MTAPDPVVSLEVDLGSMLAPIVERCHEELAREVAGEVDAVLEALGIPGHCEATVTHSGSLGEGGLAPLRVSVDRRRCRYSPELIHQLGEVFAGAPGGPRALEEIAARARAHQDTVTAVQFLAAACREIVKLHASLLLGDAQAVAYAERLWATGKLPREEWPVTKLVPVLRSVLALWISLADTTLVASVLAQAGDGPDEELIAALRPNRLEVELAPAFLRSITLAFDAEGPDSVPYLREELYRQLGLQIPHCSFTPAEDLTRHEICFRINALRSAPVLGVEPGKLLVNDTPDAVSLVGVEATEAAFPFTGRPGAATDASYAKLLEDRELITWNSWEHLILALAETLRAHGYRLIDKSIVEEEMAVVAAAYPPLVATARSLLPSVELSRLERALLRELGSIRDLPRILAAAVEWSDRAFAADLRLPTAGDSTDSGLVAFVRIALARQLQEQHAEPGSDTIYAYLLDPTIEAALMADAPVPDESRDAAVNALQREVGELEAGTPLPVVLTTGRARSPVVATICDELPRVRVLSDEELVPWANVQPLARVSLTD